MMKVRALIKKLEKLEKKIGNKEVIIDFDIHGYYNLEKVKIVKDEDSEALLINLKSSNES
jgi:hypothetical protein